MSARSSDFELLFDAEFERCVRVARRIVGDEQAAIDVAAEAFARAWSRWRHLRSTRSPAAWVLTVTSNAALDHVRRRRPPLVVAEILGGPADLVVERMALAEALRALPRRQRAAVTLRYLADWSEADVATALGVSSGSVKTHLHRGLAQLRKLLSDSEGIA